MTAITLDGNALAATIKDDLRTRIDALADRGITPGLGTVLVGDDGPSANYVSMKHQDCAELGMHSVDRRLPADATQAQVEAAVGAARAAEGAERRAAVHRRSTACARAACSSACWARAPTS